MKQIFEITTTVVFEGTETEALNIFDQAVEIVKGPDLDRAASASLMLSSLNGPFKQALKHQGFNFVESRL